MNMVNDNYVEICMEVISCPQNSAEMMFDHFIGTEAASLFIEIVNMLFFSYKNVEQKIVTIVFQLFLSITKLSSN